MMFRLTRDEAAEIAKELLLTDREHNSIDNPETRAETDELIRALQLEANVRDHCGWWGDDDPFYLAEEGRAPDVFDVSSDALPFLAEVLPVVRAGVASVLDDCERQGRDEDAEDVRGELRLLDAVAERLDAEAVTA